MHAAVRFIGWLLKVEILLKGAPLLGRLFCYVENAPNFHFIERDKVI